MDRRLAAVVCAGVLALAGCGDDGSADADDPAETVSTSPTPSETSAETPTASAPAPTGTVPTETAPTETAPIPRDPVEGEFRRGLSSAQDDEEREVEEAWAAYWEVLIPMYHAARPDRAAVEAVATGPAASGPLDYVTEMRAAGNSQVGGAIGATTSIRVTGGSATVLGCFRNTTVDVDAAGDPVEQAHPFLVIRDTLRRTPAGWRTTESTTVSRGEPCDYR